MKDLLTVNALDTALQLMPEGFSLDGQGGLFFEGIEIPPEIKGRLSVESIDNMLSGIQCQATSIRGRIEERSQ